MSLPIIRSTIAGSLWIAASAVTVSMSLATADIGEGVEPPYNSNEETTIGAIIADTKEVRGHSPLEGIHLLVIAKKQEIDIYLGPSDFIKGFEMTFSKGDSVWITGANVIFSGKRIILARKISKGSAILYLRNQDGQPNWRNEAT